MDSYQSLLDWLSNGKEYVLRVNDQVGEKYVDLRVTWVCVHLTWHQNDLKVD